MESLEDATHHIHLEVTADNLEYFLNHDVSFIQFFNNFLTLPAFPQRILYNVVTDTFEEFQNTLADNTNGDGNVKQIANLKQQFNFFKTALDEKRTRIGYYVTFLNKEEAFDWVKKYRLGLFLKSEIYADYKLSKLLAQAQSSFLLQLFANDITDVNVFANDITDVNIFANDITDVETKENIFIHKKSSCIGETGTSSTRGIASLNVELENKLVVDDIDISKLPLWQQKQMLRSEGIEVESIADSETCQESFTTEEQESQISDLNEAENKNVRSCSVTYQYTRRRNMLYRVQEASDEDEEASIFEVENDEEKINEESRKREQGENKNDVFIGKSSEESDEEELEEEELDEDKNTNEINPLHDTSINVQENISRWLRKISSKTSTTELRESIVNKGESYMELKCEDIFINKLLDSANNIQPNKDQPVYEVADNLLQKTELYPINLSYKQGMDAFKEFLCETPGEKNLLLWLEIERSKHYNSVEQKRTLGYIKDHFIRGGAPYEILQTTRKKWGIENVSEISMDKMIEISPTVVAPLLKYWCQRFIIHQHRRKTKFIKNAIFKVMQHKSVPRRPLSCVNHLNTDSKLDRSCGEKNATVFNGKDSGITRQKLRCKSAYPRLVSTKMAQNTNVGYEQLQLVVSINDEGFGFKPPPIKYFRNEACALDERRNVRLYIKPVPPLNCNASTVTSVSDTHEEDVRDNSREYEKDLDSLVDLLLHEKHSGQFFLKYLQQQDKQLWLSCYMFWTSLQEYNEHFFSTTFNPTNVARKANFIFTNYIAENCPYNVECPSYLRKKIIKQLDPPYEDLYDGIEKIILNTLLEPWMSLIVVEKNQYQHVNTEEHIKYIEVNKKSRYKYSIDKQSDIEIENEQGVIDNEESNEEKISQEEVHTPLPTSKDGFGFDTLIRNKNEMKFFQSFLESKHKKGVKDLTAWTDMELFRRLPYSNDDDSERDAKAKDIKTKWLNEKYFFGSDSPATKGAIQKIAEIIGSNNTSLPDRPSTPVITEAQKYARARVERRWLMLFKETKDYLHRKKQRSGSVTEIVEDLIMKKKIQRSEHAWRLLNSRWNSNSRDVTSLRMALSDPIQCDQFQRFISIRGDLMVNNLNFWLEVQKYKDLCHSHVEQELVNHKLQTIIDVFIKSQIPPELQIDIPIEISERIKEKLQGRSQNHGPYLFREAQTTVFRIMYNFWKDFIAYRVDAISDLSQSLRDLECKHHADIAKRKLSHQRKQLNKLVTEKRRRDFVLKERERSKPQDLFSYLSKTVSETDESTPDNLATSFLYSRHVAEDELESLETRMREQGFIEEEDAGTVASVFAAKKSVLSASEAATAREMGARGRRMSFFNTHGALLKRKQSLGVAYSKKEELRDLNAAEKSVDDGKSRFTRASRRPSICFKLGGKSSIMQVGVGKSTYGKSSFGKSTYGKSTYGKSTYGKLTNGKSTNDKFSEKVKSSKLKDFDEVSCISDYSKMMLKKVADCSRSEKRGSRLTKQSLQQLEKSFAGKPKKGLFVQTSNEENLSIILPPVVYVKPPSPPVKKPVMKTLRIPRNAGTAAILAKLKDQKKNSKSKVTVPEITAEVIVY